MDKANKKEVIRYSEATRKKYGIKEEVEVSEKDYYRVLNAELKSIQIGYDKLSRKDFQKYVGKYVLGYEIKRLDENDMNYQLDWGTKPLRESDVELSNDLFEALIGDSIHILNKINVLLGINVEYESYEIEEGKNIVIKIKNTKGKKMTLVSGTTTEGVIRNLYVGIQHKGQKYKQLMEDILNPKEELGKE